MTDNGSDNNYDSDSDGDDDREQMPTVSSAAELTGVLSVMVIHLFGVRACTNALRDRSDPAPTPKQQPRCSGPA